ncbi:MULTISPECIES: hypothetical protein [unclassified Nocardioides]|uniref:hypothetical protein n=1 Tax=unclassified Nocardioides TaxID=2615069 RepID=UPI003607C05D
MEHFLLPDLVVVRDHEAGNIDANRPRDLVLGGVALSDLAEFQVGHRHCRAGVSDSATADSVGPEAGSRTDLRPNAPATVTLDGASFDLWQLPEWWVGSRTVLHLVLLQADARPVDYQQVPRLLIRALRFEKDGVTVAPNEMAAFGGGRVLQCTAEFDGQVAGLSAVVG